MQARRVHSQNDRNSIRSLLSSRIGSVQSRCYPRGTSEPQGQWWRLSLSSNRQHCSKQLFCVDWSNIIIHLDWSLGTHWGLWDTNHYMYSSHVNGCHLSSANGTTIYRFSPFSHHPPFSNRNGEIEQPDMVDFAQPNTSLSHFLIQISLPTSQWHGKGRTRPLWLNSQRVLPFWMILLTI